ncbi:MAG: hypothetical protein P8O93_07775 [Flavobacteriaceae bacterium]|jgi:hypothetical protein|nr:hypothetical protein [Flavobacteriaceae bacterium]
MKNLLLILTTLFLISCNTSNQALSALSQNDGKIGIGTLEPDELLTVKGTIHAQEVKIDLKGALVPDYVFDTFFEPNNSHQYYRRSLEELRQFLSAHHHLPGVPSAQEIENKGLAIGDLNMILLEKIEELTLYILEQDQRMTNLEQNCKNDH